MRGAAAFALGQFSEYLQPEIVQHYEAVLPALFGVMEGAEASVQVGPGWSVGRGSWSLRGHRCNLRSIDGAAGWLMLGRGQVKAFSSKTCEG